MSIPGSASPLFLASTAAAAGGYDIPRSLRFNSGDSAYLNRTPSSAGNRRTFTFSFWAKLGDLAAQKNIITASSTPGASNASSPRTEFRFTGNGGILFATNITGSSWNSLSTTAVFRDPSAWYHVVVAVDTTQATESNRVKIYVNGVQELWSGSVAGQNDETPYNNTYGHAIGAYANNYNDFFDGYLAEFISIDGQALAPSDFGEYDSNSVWQPKEYAGTYGTNGFHLDFSDTSSDSALGTDSSGQGNDWSVNNLVAAGSAWYNSQTWSDVLYTAGTPSDAPTVTAKSFLSGYPATLPFNGNTNRAANETYAAESLKTIVFRPGTALTGVTKLEIFTNGTNTTDAGYNSATSVITSNTNVGWQTLYDGTAITLNYVWAYENNGQGAFSGLKINGLMLVDAGVSDPLAAGIDALRDSPVNGDSANDTGAGGEITGNYATLNPLLGAQTLSNGNLDVTGGSSWQRSVSTIAMSSGKWYWEYEITASNEHIVGVGPLDMQMGGNLGAGSPPGSGYGTELGQVNGTGANGSWSNTGGSTTGDLIGVAFDADAGNMYIYKNGTALNSGTASHTGLTNGPYYAVFSLNGSSRSGSVNFGQRSWAYAAPTNFKALCTANLSDPLIADGSTAFDAKAYAGTGSALTITGMNLSPDLIWIKDRGPTPVSGHKLEDAVRGAGKYLSSNTTGAEVSPSNGVTSFNSDGFTLGTDNAYNDSGHTFIAWTWDAGSSTVTNTDGSISSQVRANPSVGFSIVSFTAQASGSGTIGHGLGVTPEFVIVKSRDAAYSWIVWHKSLTSAAYSLILNTNAAQSTSIDAWNNTLPTSSVFSLGADYAGASNSVAYCFAPVEGYSAFGSYTGNGSATDGPFVYTGFKIAFLMIKNISAASNWIILDNARDPINDASKRLSPNLSNAEDPSSTLDFTSTGFKIRRNGQTENINGNTYVYIAFASHPFKTARAR